MEAENTRKVLFIDDEKSILSALERLFRNEPNIQVFTALSGREGLEIMEKEGPDLLVVDQLMPEMKGDELLALVKEKFPDTLRIMFTGYANMETIVSAINTGEVYRFLTKPWNDEDLKITIRKALEYGDLLRQNQQLTDQIKIRNEELTALNSSLEQKVKQRTAQLEQTIKFLKDLSDTVKKNFHGLVLLFADLMSLSHVFLGSHSKRVADLSNALAEKLKLEGDAREVVYYGALLHDIGLVGVKETLVGKSIDELTEEEMERFKLHPQVGEKLIGSVHNLKRIASIIRSHHEEYSGGGFPDNLSGKEISQGARIVHIANDFDSLIFKEKKTPEEALKIMEQRSSLNYDPEMLNYFVEIAKTGITDKKGKAQMISVLELRPGMFLNEDVLQKNGMLLVPKGVILTTPMIDKINSLSSLIDINRKVEAVF